MIMGVINFPELGSFANRIEEEFDYFCRKHQHILLKRLFVFNFSFDALIPPPPGLSDDPDSLVIFPPGYYCYMNVYMAFF